MRPIRAAFIKKGLIKPCVPTPMRKDSSGSWVVYVPVFA